MTAYLESSQAPRCRYWILSHLPCHKRTHWLLGNLFDILKPNHHLMIREAAEDLGGVFRIRVFWMQARPLLTLLA